MSPHYERARTLYSLWRLFTTHESGVAVVDTMMVRMGPSKVATEDVVLLAARNELIEFMRETRARYPDGEFTAIAVMHAPSGGIDYGPYDSVPRPVVPVHATLRVGADFPQLEREFLELCVDPAFPHLRRHPGPVPVPG